MLTNLIVFLLVGAVAGWIASNVMRGGSLGLLGNIIVGIVGAFIGGSLLRVIGIYAYGLLGSIVTATIGAVVLLWVIGILKK